MQVLFVQGHDFTVRSVSGEGTVERERHGAVRQYCEFVVQQR